MTVSSTSNRKTYTGDGVTVAFATSPVIFFDAGDLKVYKVVTATGVATLQTITTDYTVSGGSGSTGTVTMVTAPTAAQTLVIVRELDLVQEVDFVNNEATDAEVAEDALDKLTLMAQQLSARLDRAISLADSDVTGASLELPTPEASALIGWDSAGTALQNYAAADLDTALTTPFTLTLLDDATAAAARTTLGLGTMAVEANPLTTNGDLLTREGGVLARKAIGTTAEILGVNDAGTLMEYRSNLGPSMSVGKNLIGRTNSGTPNSQIDFDADEFVVTDSNGSSIKLSSVNITSDITASGANGLDTGAEASNTWYYHWVIYNPSTATVAGLLSTSATAPTMPAGYTFKGLASAVRNSGSSNFIAFTQRGNSITFDGNQQPLSGGSATSDTEISLAAVMPPVALEGYGSFSSTITADGSGNVQSNFRLSLTTGNAWTSFTWNMFGLATSSGGNVPFAGIPLKFPNVQQKIFYCWTVSAGSSPSASMVSLGFTLPIGGQ